MLTTTETLPLAEYVRRLKPLLPDEAFLPCPSKLLRQMIHFLFLLGSYVGIRFSGNWLIWFLCSLMIGHSLACLGFFAHELSHNAILRNRRIRYIFEIVCWGLILISPTVWRRVHNHTHHIYANTVADPDRRFLTSEDCRITWWYSRIFHPNNESSRWNFIVYFDFVPYIFRNTVAAFYPNQTKPTLVTAKPTYTQRERITVALELLAIIALQWAIFHFVGGDFKRFVFASPVAVLITSSIVMSYIFTNHLLNPESSDLLTNTTSIVVYRIFDRLHLNFSYHTEHHLFPGMNSDYYPKVSQLLTDRYGNRYNRVRFGDAWNQLWKIPVYASNETESDVHAALPTGGVTQYAYRE